MLIDVADKLNPGWGWTSYREDDPATEPAIERKILELLEERCRAVEAERAKKLAEMAAKAAGRRSPGQLLSPFPRRKRTRWAMRPAPCPSCSPTARR
jgi:hypothetical protein